jgi:beta-lactamase class A
VELQSKLGNQDFECIQNQDARRITPMTQGELLAQLELEAQHFSGTFGIMVRTLEPNPADRLEFGFNANEAFPAASVIKLPMLIDALRQVQAGLLKLEDRHVVRASDHATGSGVLQVMQAGLEPTLRDLLALMIVVSDNTATNRTLDVLGGVDATNARFAKLGLETSRVVGKLQVAWEFKTEAQRQGKLAEITPLETLEMLERLWYGELLGFDMRELALEILGGQQYTEIIARYLPEEVKIATKSGSITGVRNDVGIVYAHRPYAVALASKGSSDHREHFDNEGVLTLARISKLLYDFTQTRL